VDEPSIRTDQSRPHVVIDQPGRFLAVSQPEQCRDCGDRPRRTRSEAPGGFIGVVQFAIAFQDFGRVVRGVNRNTD
jgi:hypothetical protein